jgi:hypothetical protein
VKAAKPKVRCPTCGRPPLPKTAKVTQEIRASMQAMRRAKATYREIADAHGVSVRTAFENARDSK